VSDDLPRRLSFFDASTIVVGSMIGSGIFLKASGIAQKLADPWIILVVWAVSGALTLFGALAMAELGAMYPRAGGLYVYLHDAYGPFVAFLFGWCLLAILQTGSIAGLAVGVTRAIAAQVTVSPDVEPIISVFLIVLFSAVNLMSVRTGAGLQNFFTVCKTVGILLLIAGGVFLARGSLANLTAHATPTVEMSTVSAFGACMLAALWAYDGWINVTFMAGEVQEPQRNLPRALAAGTLFVIGVYVATNAAYHFVLPVEAIGQAKNVSREVAAAFLGASGAVVMTIIVMLSSSGTLNSSVMTGPRVYYAMAKDGLFFPSVAAVHERFLTPHVAIIVQAVWSMLLLIRWKTFDALTDNVVFIFWIFYALGAGAVIIMRRRFPDAERPYKTPGYPFVPIIFILGALFLIINTIVVSTQESREAVYLLIIGAVLYPFFRSRYVARQ